MNEPLPKVSVLMVTYNHAPYIERAIESVCSQVTDFPVELLVGDDASSDGTADIIRTCHSRDARIHPVLRDQNVGMMSNASDLHDRCRGEYIAFLDGDDYWTTPDKLALQVAALDAHPEWSLCFHRVACVDERGEVAGYEFPLNVPSPYGLRQVLFENIVPTCSIMFRKRLLSEYPAAFRRLPLGDWPLCILLAERGVLGFLPEVMAAYRLHANSGWSAKPRWQRELATLQMLLTMQDEVRPEHRSLVREACEQRFREIHDCPWHLKLRREIGARFGIEGLIKSVREFPWPWRSARP
jgi:glycosyltransferase involved in cell wall biosynthesis